jgi:hypothetical protein
MNPFKNKILKRQREIDQKQRIADRVRRKTEQRARKSDKPDSVDGGDPDIAHIVPGPQPPSEE